MKMLKKSIYISIAIIGALTLWLSTSYAAGASAGPSASTRHFTVIEHAKTDTVVDNPPKSDSIGDLLAFGNPIYSPGNTKKIGEDQGVCVRTKVGKSWECTWTLTLKQGSLVVQGPYYDNADSMLAITGGTGAWTGARGTMRLHARSAGTYTFTYIISSVDRKAPSK